MADNKIISDEQIVAALMSHSKYKDAANALGISERGLHNRITNGEFRALYQSAKTDLLREATNTMSAKMTDAVNIICEIMNDRETNNAIRLQAAQTLLNTAGKFSERLNVAEQNLTHQINTNQFNERWSLRGLDDD